MSERTEARLDELRATAAEFARAYAEQKYLEEFRKSKLAILMKKYEAMGNCSTAAAQDREARADPEYLALLEGLKTATEVSERLRWELEVSKMGVAIWQTKQANERAERRVYGA